MINLVRIVLLLLSLFTVVSCEEKSTLINELTLFGLKGPVETVLTEMDYEHTNINDEGYLVNSVKLTFNEQGFMTNEARVHTKPSNPDAKPRLSSESYQFDDLGRIQKQISYSQDGDPTETKFLYKEDAKLPYAGISGDKDYPYMSTLNYDDRGRLISVSLDDKDWNNLFSMQTTYNDNDQKTSYKHFYESELISERHFFYNAQGFVSKITEIDQDQNKSLLTYEYLKIDAHGNWLERKEISDKNSGYVIEKRTINYY